jgi:hypothetical protein
MAFYSNSSESGIFDMQCNSCKLNELGCLIQEVQLFYNYDACSNSTSTAILETLVSNEQGCKTYIKFCSLLQLTNKDPAQLNIFDVVVP